MHFSFFSLITTFFFIGLSPNVHDFHFSKTEIRYKTEQKSLQFSVHLFIDDLEDALKLYGTKDLNLCADDEAPNAEVILADYLFKKLVIKINDQKQAPQFIGKELSSDMMGVWCYFEIENVRAINSLEVENQILHDLFDDQQNIMAYYINSKNITYDIYDNKDVKLSFNGK